ncbi:MAG: PadR family transcriptional regulator [Eubacteriaceae bacterium]|nr:PadR family transcriptional regulator [Eubacteriaceae bacterium]
MEYFEMDCPCKGKNLDKLLQPAILKILYDRNMHGFMLIEQLGDNPMFGGTSPDKAGVYRYLKKMEESGLLSSGWENGAECEKPRRVYAITDKGRGCLGNWLEALKKYTGSIDMLIKDIEDTVDSAAI